MKGNVISNMSNSREETLFSGAAHEIINSENSHNLRKKFNTIEGMFDDLYKEIMVSKDEIIRLIKERDSYEAILENATVGDKNELLKELESEMWKMESYFESQKNENEELQLKIARLKTQKTVLQGKFIALQRRIANLEMQVGSDEVKFD